MRSKIAVVFAAVAVASAGTPVAIASTGTYALAPTVAHTDASWGT